MAFGFRGITETSSVALLIIGNLMTDLMMIPFH